MGKLLRGRRLWIGATAAEIAETDGTWKPADVLMVENSASLEAAVFNRYQETITKLRVVKGLTGRV